MGQLLYLLYVDGWANLVLLGQVAVAKLRLQIFGGLQICQQSGAALLIFVPFVLGNCYCNDAKDTGYIA